MWVSAPIDSSVTVNRRRCRPCKKVAVSSFIDTVERSKVEGCVLNIGDEPSWNVAWAREPCRKLTGVVWRSVVSRKKFDIGAVVGLSLRNDSTSCWNRAAMLIPSDREVHHTSAGGFLAPLLRMVNLRHTLQKLPNSLSYKWGIFLSHDLSRLNGTRFPHSLHRFYSRLHAALNASRLQPFPLWIEGFFGFYPSCCVIAKGSPVDQLVPPWRYHTRWVSKCETTEHQSHSPTSRCIIDTWVQLWQSLQVSSGRQIPVILRLAWDINVVHQKRSRTDV